MDETHQNYITNHKQFFWETMKSTLEHYVKNDSASVDIQSCYLQFSGS